MIDEDLKKVDKESFSAKDPEKRYPLIFGVQVQKSWLEMFQLEALIYLIKPKRIIELGTGSGGVSLFMAMNTYMSDSEFYTFDIGSEKSGQRINNKTREMIEGIGGNVIKCDIFSNDSILAMKDLIRKEGTTILYCDNGDKFRELELFGAYLKTGDYILTHDYGTELTKEEWQVAIDSNDLTEVAPDWFDEHDTLHRCAVKL